MNSKPSRKLPWTSPAVVPPLPCTALALAFCGQTDQAKPLVDELIKRYPEDTLINSISLPVIRAAMGLQPGNAARAIEQLQTTSRYEAAAEFWPQYLRGQAYLNLKQGKEARTEVQKILDHRGQAPLSVLYPLAHLGLARAAALAGDKAKSRAAYEDFFKLWKTADSDLPILLEAKKRHTEAPPRPKLNSRSTVPPGKKVSSLIKTSRCANGKDTDSLDRVLFRWIEDHCCPSSFAFLTA